MRLGLITALAVASMALGVGCAAPINVPPSAQLIYYGPGNNVNLAGARPVGTGRVYLVDETENQVVSVFLVSDGQDFEFGRLNPKHNYRLYFEPVALTTAQPAQQ